MKCPCCKGVELKDVTIAFVEIDECPSCHGLFFDNFELQHLDESHEGEGAELERILSYEASTVKRDEKIVCPRCECKMREHRFSAACDVRVDECASCGGMWLDQGELGEIRKNYASDEERAKLMDAIASECGFDAARMNQAHRKQQLEERMHRGRGRAMGLMYWATKV